MSPNAVKHHESTRAQRTAVVKAHFDGEFWKDCPGTTKGYLCCGYQILTPLTGCGMYCRYCVLQVYFEKQHQVVFENLEALEDEVRWKMKSPGVRRVLRFGTGEFGDSLFLEKRFGCSQKIASALEPYPRALVEFKTKSTCVEPLVSVRHPERVVVGFSMNTFRIVKLLEQGTASIDERLRAARWCVEHGFHVAFHFDPMFYYPGWESEYREIVASIYRTIRDTTRIAWCSLGGFRTMPRLKTLLKETHEHLALFSEEMLPGEDGKIRYFRPIRVAMYRAMNEEFTHWDPGCTLYLCMESPEVWDRSGMRRRIPDGLVEYLDRRAEEILGIQ